MKKAAYSRQKIQNEDEPVYQYKEDVEALLELHPEDPELLELAMSDFLQSKSNPGWK